MTNIERYDYAFDPAGDAWAARVLRRVAPAGSVLELGPGPGAMTRVLLERGCRVVAIENDAQALQTLKALDVETIVADLESTEWVTALAGRRFDTVLACDVLEHLRNPEAVLRVLAEHLQPMGRLIVSIPNVAYGGVLASLRLGAFDYADKGQLDRTHVRFFTKRSVEKVLLDCGWTPRFWEANHLPIEASEFAWCWNLLPESMRLTLLDGWQDFDVYQWMVEATPSSDAPVWEMTAAREMAEKLREELQTLSQVHQREHASLLEHQKAFAEAKEIIGQLQGQVEVLRTEKAAIEAEALKQATELDELAQKAPWYLRWWRSPGQA